MFAKLMKWLGNSELSQFLEEEFTDLKERITTIETHLVALNTPAPTPNAPESQLQAPITPIHENVQADVSHVSPVFIDASGSQPPAE